MPNSPNSPTSPKSPKQFARLSTEEFPLDHSTWLDLISEAHSHVDQIREDKGLPKWNWNVIEYRKRDLKRKREKEMERERGKNKMSKTFRLKIPLPSLPERVLN